MSWHWLPFGLGLTDPNHWPYLLLSGLLGSAAIVGGLFAAWWHHLCHEHDCWHWARYQVVTVTGTAKVCRKHHGDITGHEKLTVEVLRALHAAHLVHHYGQARDSDR